jgi:SAM-dependent methyltransferase
MGNNVFKTSYGAEIPIVPGHYEFYERTMGQLNSAKSLYAHFVGTSTNVAGGFEALETEKVHAQRQLKETVSFKKYWVTYVQTRLFMDIIERYTNIPLKFKKCLDIGCGYGIQPRTLKAFGVVDEAVGIDVFDRCSQIKASNIRKLHRRLPIFLLVDWWLDRIEKKPRRLRKTYEQAALEKVSSPRRQVMRVSGTRLPRSIYLSRYRRSPELDRFIEGDVFDLDEKFDLVTSFSSIEWFQLDQIMKKVSDLLEDDGIFYMYVGSWWAATNVSALFGHFPYAAQRLNQEDFARYAEEFHGHEKEEVLTAYKYYDFAHPTISNYMEVGYKYGLMPIYFYNATMPEAYTKARGISALGYAEYHSAEFTKILDDIRKFRPDVRFEDLFSGLYYIVFKKIKKDSRLNTEFFEKSEDELNFKYRPEGKLGRMLRELAIKVFIGKK